MWDWLQGIGGGMKQSFEDQGGSQGLLENPMFNAGMGLLAHRADKNINPAGAMLQGLQSAQGNKQSNEDRALLQKVQQQMSDYMLNGGMGQMPQTPNQQPPNMSPVQPPPNPLQMAGQPPQAPNPAPGGGQMTPEMVQAYMQMMQQSPGYGGTPGIFPGY